MIEINIIVFGIPEYKYCDMKYCGNVENCVKLLEAIRALINGWDIEG